MSFISGITGVGAKNNANFTATNATPQLTLPTTQQNALDQYKNVNYAQGEAQNLAAYLGAQNGLTNQNDILAQQQQLSNALQNQSNGVGPNPAQIQYKKNIDANTAAAAGTIASQKGINPALAERMVNNTQAGANQTAASDSANTQAQQELAARNQLINQQQNMQNVAGTQVGNQITGVQNLNNVAQGAQGNVLNSINAQNNAIVGTQSNVNNANSAMAQTNANNTAGFIGNIGAGIGHMMAHGGEIKESDAIDRNGSYDNKSQSIENKPDINPLPPHLKTILDIYYPSKSSDYNNSPVQVTPNAEYNKDPSNIQNKVADDIFMALGGPVTFSGQIENSGSPDAISNKTQTNKPFIPKAPAKKDPSIEGPDKNSESSASDSNDAEDYNTQMASKGALIQDQLGDKQGIVPGQAKVPGDNLKNDTVNTMLSPGEIVLPRSVTQSKDPVKAAAMFVKETLAKKNDSSPKEDMSEFKKALQKAIKERKK